MEYEAPTFIVHGSIESLTLLGDGEDPCREHGGHTGEFKQTGAADLIHGQANLTTCVPTSV